MKIEPSLLETWLLQYKNAPYNLGASYVKNMLVEELISLTGCSIEEIYQLSLGDNDSYGSLGLRKAISSLYNDVEPDSILVTAGTTEAILIYFHVRYQPGANIVVTVPGFHILYEVPKFLGYEVRYLHLRPENNFRLDLDELSKLVDDKTQTIVLNIPHNPTGVVYSQAEIQTVCELAQKHNAEILSDEHYRFIPHTGDIDIIPSLYGRTPNIVALGSPGKCFGCVGLRIGWLIGSKEVIDASHTFKDYTTYTVCSINDFLATSALLNREQILAKPKAWIARNVLQLQTFIDQHSEMLGWLKPDAGTVAFPFFQDKSIKSDLFAQKLVEETGVLVLPGEAFDMPSFFRISLGVNPEEFNTALNAFLRVLKTY